MSNRTTVSASFNDQHVNPDGINHSSALRNDQYVSSNDQHVNSDKIDHNSVLRNDHYHRDSTDASFNDKDLSSGEINHNSEWGNDSYEDLHQSSSRISDIHQRPLPDTGTFHHLQETAFVGHENTGTISDARDITKNQEPDHQRIFLQSIPASNNLKGLQKRTFDEHSSAGISRNQHGLPDYKLTVPNKPDRVFRQAKSIKQSDSNNAYPPSYQKDQKDFAGQNRQGVRSDHDSGYCNRMQHMYMYESVNEGGMSHCRECYQPDVQIN